MSRILGSSNTRRVANLAIAVIVGTFFSLSVHAQLMRGGVSGTVIDQQKAAVAGVMVILTNQDKGVVQTTTTNEVGVYHLSAVDPGSYAVDFTKDGFETQKSGSITVLSGKDTTVDAALTVGAVSSQIYVTVPGMELDKSSPSVRLNLTGKTLDEIPMGTSSLVPGGSRN